VASNKQQINWEELKNQSENLEIGNSYASGDSSKILRHRYFLVTEDKDRTKQTNKQTNKRSALKG